MGFRPALMILFAFYTEYICSKLCSYQFTLGNDVTGALTKATLPSLQLVD